VNACMLCTMWSGRQNAFSKEKVNLVPERQKRYAWEGRTYRWEMNC